MTRSEWEPDDPPEDDPEGNPDDAPGAEGGAEGGGYDIGYAKPPKHSRFKPGQSGNPKGRPKGARSLAACVQEELNAKVTVREDGRTRTLSKREALAKRVVNDGIAGNASAIKQIAALETSRCPAAEAQVSREDTSRALDQVDLYALADWAAFALARQRGDEEGEMR